MDILALNRSDALIQENNCLLFSNCYEDLKKDAFVFLKRHKAKLEGNRVVNYSRMNHMEAGLAVTEETLRMVVLKWLQTVWSPHGAQTHLFPGKLSWSLYTIILSFCLQIHIKADTQA